jgi:peptidoglycan DL-endopeptidase LytF
MTRRDTILMAVLINAGLLIILFSTALTQESSLSQRKDSVAQEVRRVQEPVPIAVAIEESRVPAVVPEKRAEDVDAVVTRYATAGEITTSVPQTPNPIVAAPISAPPPAVAPVAPTSSSWLEVTVKRGDTLDKIARANGTTVEVLMQANALSTTRLQVGDVLRVPASQPPQAISRAVPEQAPSGEFYTIRSGDNPWAVAMKFHVPLNELLKLNDLDEDAARKLKPGDRIRIR